MAGRLGLLGFARVVSGRDGQGWWMRWARQDQDHRATCVQQAAVVPGVQGHERVPGELGRDDRSDR
jgi:hypothetical protein